MATRGWEDWTPPADLHRRMPKVQARASKYHAKKTVVDNITFDSQKEATRYQELKLMEQAGQIVRLEIQPEYPLTVQGNEIGIYRGDFRYVVPMKGTVIEDVKGFKTPLYRWKKKHVEAQYGITIREL